MRGLSRAATIGVALVAVAVVGCGDNRKVAFRELKDPDPYIRGDAAQRLGQAKAVEAVESLIVTLDDPAENVRIESAIALGRIGDPSAVPALLEAGTDPVDGVRVAVCQALTELRDPRSIDALERLLFDEDEIVRLNAARALTSIPDRRAAEVLIETALRDESELIRQHVIRVMGRQGAREIIPSVEQALSVETDLVRANAAFVLGNLGDRSSVPAMIEALEDPYFKVRGLSAHGLAKIAPGDPEVIRALNDRLSREDHDVVRVDLAWNLAVCGDRSGLPLIRELLFHGRPDEARAEAAIALGEIGSAEDVPILEKAVRDKRGFVAIEADNALRKLKGNS